MRLTEYERDSIKKAFLEVFKDGEIYLFGSRVDDSKKGGDIDLFIKLSKKLDDKELLDKKINFKLRLYELIGEQKIDVVFDDNEKIARVAMESGIRL